MTDIGDYYDRIAIERRAVVKAFAEVRARIGEGATVERVLSVMRQVEDEAGNTGD